MKGAACVALVLDDAWGDVSGDGVPEAGGGAVAEVAVSEAAGVLAGCAVVAPGDSAEAVVEGGLVSV